MKSKLLLLPLFCLFACEPKPVAQFSENTFVYKSKLYKLMNNELIEIADFNADSVRKLSMLVPRKKELGTASLNYIKPGAKATVDALYRGNFLYYKITVMGLNDLKENYRLGHFTVDFQDEFGFDLQSVQIPAGVLTGVVNDSGEILYYAFSDKLETSQEISTVIRAVSISSTVRRNDSGY